MSAIPMEQLEDRYVIMYFDGKAIVPFEVYANSREEAISLFKAEGHLALDIYSINP
ncbi:hypothetical protein [Vibrio maerlii]|uniref:hypothetical protein n=1 Tax=Vibrio maerlii TaxID=2231648 RepID=UPI0013E00D32|nr:hypothetical protein [Vibrio maerlii]